MLVEDTTITPIAGQTSDPVDHYALGRAASPPAGWRCTIAPTAFAWAARASAAGPVVVEDSFINVNCAAENYHTDGIQGYDGDRLTIRNVTIDYEGGCGTSPIRADRQ